MGTYDRQIAQAARQIAARGRACIWSQGAAATPPDPSRPWLPGAAVVTTYPVSIVFLPSGGDFLRQLGVTDAKTGEDYGMMPQVPFVPTVSGAEIYASDGVTFLRKVERIKLLAPDGVPILYTLYFAAAG